MSPSKLMSYQTYAGKVRLNQIEKISSRLENLKKEDQLMRLDIVEHFWERMKETQQALGI
jgi:hypothetical protein